MRTSADRSSIKRRFAMDYNDKNAAPVRRRAERTGEPSVKPADSTSSARADGYSTRRVPRPLPLIRVGRARLRPTIISACVRVPRPMIRLRQAMRLPPRRASMCVRLRGRRAPAQPHGLLPRPPRVLPRVQSGLRLMVQSAPRTRPSAALRPDLRVRACATRRIAIPSGPRRC